MNEIDSKKTGKIAKYVIIAVVLLVIAFNCWYTIDEKEAAVITTFGVPSTETQAGFHFKIPFIQQVTKVDTTIKGFPIGYVMETDERVESESLMITLDFNFVNVDFFVEYKVTDPIKALYASEDPQLILKNLAQSCIRDTIGLYNVDAVITTGKNEIQSVIKEKIISQLEGYDIGIQLINISIQDAEPPTEAVVEAFRAVESAKQGAETTINNAKKYQNEKIPECEAAVDRIRKEAQAEKEARINEAEGQVARFNAMYEEYKKYPLITKQRMFYEAMEELLPGLKIIIDNSEGGVQKILPLEELVSITTDEPVID